VKSASGKPSLLFVIGDFWPHGGGSCVIAWCLQALREKWDVTILAISKPDFKSINEHFGTSLNNCDFTIRTVPFPLNHVNKLDPDPYGIQQLACLMRVCQWRSQKYDAVMCGNDEFDFGRPGIQYTHFPHLQGQLEVLRATDHLNSRQRLGRFLTGKLRPWLLISGIRLSRMKSNLMVTNSLWTASVLREIYGVEAAVVYPPVLWKAPRIPWARRNQSFVCLGRLSPEKRLLELIGIIEQVRARGYELVLEIIGDKGALASQRYDQKVSERIARAGDWVRLHRSVSRSELEKLVSHCRFGIHGMIDEHFGIAPAELMRAGCLVFVPNNGGQVEIVGDHPELRYESDEDAVEKICRVLADRETQSRLRQALSERSDLFSESAFMNSINKAVFDFVNPVSGHPAK